MGALDSGRLGTRAGGRAATLLLHSGGGEARDGGPPPGDRDRQERVGSVR